MKFKFLSLLLIPILAQAAPKCHEQIRVAVVDTGLDLKDPRFTGHLCKTGHANYVSDEGIYDHIGHGTFVAGLIEQNAGDADYCLLIYKYYEDGVSGQLNHIREMLSFKEAIKNGATIVNFSAGGTEFSQEEADLIKNNPKVTFVVAAGNEGQNIDISGNEYYPASLPYGNVIAVGNLKKNGDKSSSSDWGKKVVWEVGDQIVSYLPNGQIGFMSGTSMATGVRTGKLLDSISKSCNYR